MTKDNLHCVCCGCELAPYEVFAGRIRGLKKPVCVGCAFDAVVFLRDHLWPMLEKIVEVVVNPKRGDAHEGCIEI